MPRPRQLGTRAQRDRKANTLRRGAVKSHRGGGIVAEGDSWFDYVVQPDLIDHLINTHGLPIKSVAHHGHLLMDMVYGTNVDMGKRGQRSSSQQIDETVRCLAGYEPRVFLFSGGGNDLAGPELLSFLRPAAEGDEKVDWPRLEALIHQTYATAYRRLHEIVNQVKPGIHFVTHGYAHPFPDGRSVGLVFGVFRVAGPWLRSAFHAMGHTDDRANFRDMARMIDSFNAMLAGLATELDRFHHVDLRTAIPTTATNYQQWWANELHPGQDGFRAAAAAVALKVNELMD